MIDTSIRNNLHIGDCANDHIGDNCDGNINAHGGIMTTNRHNRTPLQNLCRSIDKKNNHMALEKILCCYQKCPNIPILHSALTSVSQPKYFKVLIEFLENNVGVTYKHIRDFRNKGLLEAAIGNACIDVNNSKQKQQLQHARGIIQILLHWSYDVLETSTKCNDGDAEMCEVMKVSHYRDEKKRLPIHYACELGLSFHGGLEDIVKSNSSALEDTDEVTGLLPFMLAAAAFTSAHTCVIYQLLRRNPNQIQTLRQR